MNRSWHFVLVGIAGFAKFQISSLNRDGGDFGG